MIENCVGPVGEEHPLKSLYGEGHLVKFELDVSGVPVWPGNVIDYVPINDYSYLRHSGLTPTLIQQKKITLFSEDLDATVYPLTPKFLVLPEPPFTFVSKFSLDIP